jgi:acetolactate synthase-1/2/3 large subunit
VISEVRAPAGEGRMYEMPADQVAEAVLAAAKLGGVDRVWFTSGSELGVLQEAAVKNRALGRPTPDIMTITHEQVSLAAACGETAVTRKPAGAAFHVECGLINAGAAIHQADRGRHPVLLLSGYPPSAGPGVTGGRASFINWYQQVRDQGELVRQYMRWDHKLTPYDNPGLVVTRALQVAQSAPRGPACLILPRETIMHPIEGARFPLLDQLRPPEPPIVDPEHLRQVARWLLEAEQPLICLSEFGGNPAGVPAVLELAELVGARLMGDNVRMNVPGRHPFSRGEPGRAPVPPGTDFLLALDCVVPWLPRQWEPTRRTRIVRIDEDPAVHMTPVYEFVSDLSLTADSSKAVAALLEEVRRQMTPAQRARCDQRAAALRDEGQRLFEGYVAACEADRASGHLTPRWVSYQLGETLGPDATITYELADASGFNRSQPGTLFGGVGSGLGFAGPAAVGIKVAEPARRVVSVTGDGSWMFANPQVTLWASRFHRAPVLFVIYNNRGYSTGTREVARLFPEGYSAQAGDFTGGFFDPPPNYSGEAAASGCYGEKVTDPDEVAPAIGRALDAMDRQGVPAVLDMWLPKLITGEL